MLPVKPSMFDSVSVEYVRGDLDDYEQLAQFHYAAGRPVNFTKIWAAHCVGFSEVEKVTEIEATVVLVGVLVESVGRLNSTARDAAMPGQFAPMWQPERRAADIELKLRCITRVIVHPNFRGAGIGVGLVRHALAHRDRPIVEAYARMGHVCPFFQRAGMKKMVGEADFSSAESANVYGPIYYWSNQNGAGAQCGG